MIYKTLIAAATSITLSASSMAAMTIAGTRVIFPGGEQEVTVRTTNKGDKPTLVQVWVVSSTDGCNTLVKTLCG